MWTRSSSSRPSGHLPDRYSRQASVVIVNPGHRQTQIPRHHHEVRALAAEEHAATLAGPSSGGSAKS